MHLASPKTMLFFSALLPQFINVDEPILLQLLIISFILLLTQAVVSVAYGVMGEHMRTKASNIYLAKSINKVSGFLFISAGAWLSTVRKE